MTTKTSNMTPEFNPHYPYGVPQTALDVEALAMQERFFAMRFTDETIEEVDAVLDACRADATRFFATVAKSYPRRDWIRKQLARGLDAIWCRAEGRKSAILRPLPAHLDNAWGGGWDGDSD